MTKPPFKPVPKKQPFGKLQWRCRRGTKELDWVMQGFLNQRYLKESPEIQAAFAALLERQDPEISDWLQGKFLPEEQSLRDMVAILRKPL